MKINKNGGITCFLSIIITSAVVLMTVLLKASSIRHDEALLTGLLIQQQDLALSGYSEKLLDWYGIYATSLQKDDSESFTIAASGIDRINSYSCEGTQTVEEGDNLKEAILAFSRTRVPMQLALQLLGRFTKINSLIESSKTDTINSNIIGSAKKSETETKSKDETDDNEQKTIKEIMETKEETPVSFETIFGLLRGIDQTLYEKSLNEKGLADTFSWQNMEEILKNSESNPVFETEVSKEMKSSLTVTEDTINEISSFFDRFCKMESNAFYDRLCFEIYASTMFSCKTNARIQDGIEIKRKDLRNRALSALPVQNKSEIEKIIFGFENQETNELFTEISIETIRFFLHLICNLTDNVKKAEISGISLTLCAAVALASGGTIAIPKEAMDVVVLLILSMSSAGQDYIDLMKGNGVALIPSGKAEKFDTYYMDYLQIFLLAVPEETKVGRMLNIMRGNLFLSGIPLYTGVSVSVRYRDILYRVEGQYEGYRAEKKEE